MSGPALPDRPAAHPHRGADTPDTAPAAAASPAAPGPRHPAAVCDAKAGAEALSPVASDGRPAAGPGAGQPGAAPDGGPGARRGPDGTGVGGDDLAPARLRRVLGQYATGVCAVSTRVDDAPDGAPRHDAIAVNSFTSVSLRPPLVSMCLRDDSAFLQRLYTAGVWGVSFLADDARPLLRVLTARSDTRPPVESEAAWATGPHTGCLLLTDGPGTLECALHLTQPIGDHVLVVGRVLGATYRDRDPLLFHRGGFTAVAAPA
ncbi:flavin reductase family protein [Streptomyces sp. CC77]|uniref:flavin reductase family protein n=1 Tax=Streptomyces sp. CC77 TaxID=1906739 RepID=UPI0009A129B2|nr:flavin reductase family protein [Streptomyces sp. CC77]